MFASRPRTMSRPPPSLTHSRSRPARPASARSASLRIAKSADDSAAASSPVAGVREVPMRGASPISRARSRKRLPSDALRAFSRMSVRNPASGAAIKRNSLSMASPSPGIVRRPRLRPSGRARSSNTAVPVPRGGMSTGIVATVRPAISSDTGSPSTGASPMFASRVRSRTRPSPAARTAASASATFAASSGATLAARSATPSGSRTRPPSSHPVRWKSETSATSRLRSSDSARIRPASWMPASSRVPRSVVDRSARASRAATRSSVSGTRSRARSSNVATATPSPSPRPSSTARAESRAASQRPS